MLYLLFFFVCSNIFNLNIFLIIGAFVFIIFNIWRKNRKIKINTEMISLFIFGVTYAILYQYHFPTGLLTFVMYAFVPSISYFIGYNCLNNSEILIHYKKITIIIAFAMFVHGTLNMTLFIEQLSSRTIPDFWTRIPMAATLQATYFSMLSALLFYALIITKEIKIKILVIISSIFIVDSTLKTATRTNIYIILIVFMLNVLYFYVTNRKYRKKLLKYTVIFIILLAIVLLSYNHNTLGMKSYYENSFLFNRINNMDSTYKVEDPRKTAQIYVLLHLFDYPFGGSMLDLPRNMSYAHNLWLDVIYRVGVVPFLYIFIYSSMTLVTIFKVIQNKIIPPEYKYVAISVFAAVNINFLVEPIIEGAFLYFCYFCIFNGMTRRLVETHNGTVIK